MAKNIYIRSFTNRVTFGSMQHPYAPNRSIYIYINNSFVSFRLFLYSYDLLDLCNVLFLVNFDLIMLFISLILPYG